ncbi:MAG TPA: tripartite tricarboxylate transporter substrate binding protein [Burkholderiales bacterium]|nr:tripartite tricarboxylate transporter substrate binding protein [Burkholderiales bacterium]
MIQLVRLSVQLSLPILISFFAATALAQDYPSRPVRMIVPFGPGGASDFVARAIQPKMMELLGQTLVIDNRAGASGNVGVELAARSPADGYTIFLGNVGSTAINPSIFPTFPVKPTRDLAGLTLLVDVPGAFAVHPSVPANTVKEFIEYAKSRPGQLNYGSSGSGSAQRLAFEFFMQKAGIKLVHIPYKGGAGAATTAVLAGEVSATMVTVASFVPHVKTGKARVLAVMSPKRSQALPQVPTMTEVGFPELKLGSWQAMFVPRGTPRALVARLYDVMIKTVEDPETARRLNAGGAEIVTSKSPEETNAFLKEQTEFWAKIVKSVGATAE